MRYSIGLLKLYRRVLLFLFQVLLALIKEGFVEFLNGCRELPPPLRWPLRLVNLPVRYFVIRQSCPNRWRQQTDSWMILDNAP